MGRRWVLAKAGKTMKGEQHALIQAMRGVRGLIGGLAHKYSLVGCDNRKKDIYVKKEVLPVGIASVRKTHFLQDSPLSPQSIY